MGGKNETKVKEVDWGDGTKLKVKKPNLDKIPGGSVVCPMPCHPFGETGEDWKKNEQKTRKKGLHWPFGGH